MYKLLIIAILIGIISSCTDSNKVNNLAGKRICEQLLGKEFELSYWHERKPTKRNYIEYILYNSKLVEDKTIDTLKAVSFCALELYRNLRSNTLKENDGIKIRIETNKNTDPFITPSYYYSMHYLKDIKESANTISSYINVVVARSDVPITDYVDTSYINADTLHQVMRKLLYNFNDVILYYSFRETEAYTNTNDTLIAYPFVVQIIDRYSGKELYIEMTTLKTNNKIVSISTNF